MRIYNADINRSESSSTRASSAVRIGMLFGSLALALGLVLIPVYMKRSNNLLMDTQYSRQSVHHHNNGNAEAANGALR